MPVHSCIASSSLPGTHSIRSRHSPTGSDLDWYWHCWCWMGAICSLLDEPLNHLDIESREQFEIALTEFKGTLMIVLHDEYAVDRIANRLLRIRGGEVTEELI